MNGFNDDDANTMTVVVDTFVERQQRLRMLLAIMQRLNDEIDEACSKAADLMLSRDVVSTRVDTPRGTYRVTRVGRSVLVEPFGSTHPTPSQGNDNVGSIT